MRPFEFKYPSENDWINEAEKQLKGRPLSALNHQTDEGILLKPLYFRADAAQIGQINSADEVLIAPALFTHSKEFNAAAKKALANGQTALTIDLDLTSQFAATGFKNSDLWGMIHLTEYQHFEKLFNGIDLDSIPLFFDALLKFETLWEFWQRYVLANGFHPEKISGSLGADPLSCALLYGGFAADPQQLFSKLASVFNAKKQFSNLDVITLAADIIHNSGGHAVQELSYILSSIVYHVEQLKSFGIEPQQTLSALRVKLAVANEQFKEIAKLRALRLLWVNLCRAYNIKDPLDLKIDAVTSWRFLSDCDIHSNMLRCSSQVFSAIIGGSNSINILPFDLAVKKTSESSRRMARNTAIILLQESHLSKVKDPAAGSAFIDSYTLQLAEKSWQAFQQIEQKGGIMPVITNGEFQAAIENQAQLQLDHYKQGTKKAIGVNFYKNEMEEPSAEHLTILTSQLENYKDSSLTSSIKPLHIARIETDYEE